MEVTGPASISVVLATRNRAASLERFLTALSGQEGAPPFEVVVADNGSSDDTASVLRNAREMRLRSVRVEQPGKGRALNAALRMAEGELVVLTDDDVMPDPCWLRELHRAAEDNPDVPVFGGRIEVDPASIPEWVRRSHNLMGLLTSEHHPEQRVYGHGRYPFGPNMAVRRILLAGMESPYPEDMGPGTSLPVGDESGFLLRLSAPEARDRLYVPRAAVTHEVEPENVALATALRRSYQQGRAQGRLGIPVVESSDAGSNDSFARATVARLRRCGSARELLCVCVRHTGYMLGTRRATPPRAQNQT
jgi:hypothetical protein